MLPSGQRARPAADMHVSPWSGSQWSAGVHRHTGSATPALIIVRFLDAQSTSCGAGDCTVGPTCTATTEAVAVLTDPTVSRRSACVRHAHYTASLAGDKCKCSCGSPMLGLISYRLRGSYDKLHKELCYGRGTSRPTCQYRINACN